MTRPAERSPLRAFTLVELLVVVAVIALLIGILLPALAAARSSANSISSQGALRQIGVGLATYTETYDGMLPPGVVKTSSSGTGEPMPAAAADSFGLDSNNDVAWTTLLLREMGSDHRESWAQNSLNNNANINNVGMAELFRDPAAQEFREPSDNAAHALKNSYSAHPRLLPRLGLVDLEYRIRRVGSGGGVPVFNTMRALDVPNPSGLIMVATGSQDFNPNNPDSTASSYSNFFNTDMIGGNGGKVGLKRQGYGMLLPTNPDNPENNLNNLIDAGPNRDFLSGSDPYRNGGFGGGHIRFRHLGDSSANVVYVDGHVQSKSYDSPNSHEIQRKEITFMRPSPARPVFIQ